MSLNNKCAICYCTDVEGNIDYFVEWIKRSRYLDYTLSDQELVLSFKQSEPNSKFIFGGDVCDKGEGSIRVVKAILNLKLQHPDRVVIILGNRDLNKLRFTSELQDDQITDEMLDKLEGPYFVGPNQRVSPKQYLLKLAQKSNEQATEEDARKLNTKANRVRYMLDCTMGSAGDFERRRNEIAKMKKKEPSDISDDEVVDSYIKWVLPGEGKFGEGDLRNYLYQGVLAHYEPSIKTLFVHGGLPSVYGYVPRLIQPVIDLHKWIIELNKWLEYELKDWDSNPTWKKGRENDARAVLPNVDWSARGGNRIIAYVAPESEPTVIYTDMFDVKNNMKYLNPTISTILNNYGVRRIVVGHKPHGHCPSVMKDPKIEIIDADTSYSDMNSPTCRGQAVSAVLIDPKGSEVDGIVTDGKKIHYRLSLDNEGDQFVGRPVTFSDPEKKGWWVKAKYSEKDENGNEYILQKVDGFKVEYESVKSKDIQIDQQYVHPQTQVGSENEQIVQVDGKEIKLYLQGTNKYFSGNEIIKEHKVLKEWIKKLTESTRFTLLSISILQTEYQTPTISELRCEARVISTKNSQLFSEIIHISSPINVYLIQIKIEKEKYIIFQKTRYLSYGLKDYLELPSYTLNFDNSFDHSLSNALLQYGIDIQNSKKFGDKVLQSPEHSTSYYNFFKFEDKWDTQKLNHFQKSEPGKQFGFSFEIVKEDKAYKSPDAKTLVALYLKKHSHKSKGKSELTRKAARSHTMSS